MRATQRVHRQNDECLLGSRFHGATGRAVVFSAFALVGVLLTSRTADAQESDPAPEAGGPVTADKAQLGVGIRYGFRANEGDINPWRAGFGLDAGYTFTSAVYLGGTFEYFLGEAVEIFDTKVSAKALHFMAEGGYDLALDEHAVLRPKVGIGIANMSVDGCSGAACGTSLGTDVVASAGASFLLVLRPVGVSFDARYVAVLAEKTASAGIFGLGVMLY